MCLSQNKQPMSEARHNETEQQTQTVHCRPSDRQCRAKRRANETDEECVECRVTTKQRMAWMCVKNNPLCITLRHLHHWCFIYVPCNLP